MKKNGKPQRFSSPAVETVRPDRAALRHERCAMRKSHWFRRWARPTGAQSVPLTRLLLKEILEVAQDSATSGVYTGGEGMSRRREA